MLGLQLDDCLIQNINLGDVSSSLVNGDSRDCVINSSILISFHLKPTIENSGDFSDTFYFANCNTEHWASGKLNEKIIIR